MTRLRRSLREVVPTTLTREEKFEKMIAYVKEGNYSETLREFNMPSHIFTEFHARSVRSNSRIEKLPKKILDMIEMKLTEVERIKLGSTCKTLAAAMSIYVKPTIKTLPIDHLLHILNMLPSTEQVMLALTCKALASVVETSNIRKIANITAYNVKHRDPLFQQLLENPSEEFWHQKGFEFKPRLSAPVPAWQFFWLVRDAVDIQYNAMRGAVGKMLGSNYRYCSYCHKFRPIDKKFWEEFAEYENPGISQKTAHKPAKKKVKTDAKKEDAAATVAKYIGMWYDGNTDYNGCPAHVLLQESTKGDRLLKRYEYGT